MPEIVRIGRAVLTNVIAGVAPNAYLSLTGQTGRGSAAKESPQDIASYFERCLADYVARLPAELGERRFDGRTIVEYGPGDFPGVALLLLAHGAAKVWCVDRFPMIALSPKNLEVLQCMLSRLGAVEAERMRGALLDPADPARGFDPRRLEYVVTRHGFSELQRSADFVISRAVLEHVDDLPGTFADMKRALKPGGIALHQVDLRSHGLHRRNVLDFLLPPPWLWSLMFSNKGVPNRWRANRYREIVSALGVDDVLIEPTTRAPAEAVAEVRPRLPAPFRDLGDDDLACLGLWVGFRAPGRAA